MDFIKDSQSTLIRIVRLPRVQSVVRELLLELIEQHADLIRRDNGRGRYHPPSAAPVETPDDMRIS